MLQLEDKTKLVFGQYTVLNLLAALLWILIVFERTSRTRNPISDLGVPIGLISLFFLVPLGCRLHMAAQQAKEGVDSQIVEDLFPSV